MAKTKGSVLAAKKSAAKPSPKPKSNKRNPPKDGGQGNATKKARSSKNGSDEIALRDLTPNDHDASQTSIHKFAQKARSSRSAEVAALSVESTPADESANVMQPLISEKVPEANLAKLPDPEDMVVAETAPASASGPETEVMEEAEPAMVAIPPDNSEVSANHEQSVSSIPAVPAMEENLQEKQGDVFSAETVPALIPEPEIAAALPGKSEVSATHEEQSNSFTPEESAMGLEAEKKSENIVAQDLPVVDHEPTAPLPTNMVPSPPLINDTEPSVKVAEDTNQDPPASAALAEADAGLDFSSRMKVFNALIDDAIATAEKHAGFHAYCDHVMKKMLPRTGWKFGDSDLKDPYEDLYDFNCWLVENNYQQLLDIADFTEKLMKEASGDKGNVMVRIDAQVPITVEDFELQLQNVLKAANADDADVVGNLLCTIKKSFQNIQGSEEETDISKKCKDLAFVFACKGKLFQQRVRQQIASLVEQLLFLEDKEARVPKLYQLTRMMLTELLKDTAFADPVDMATDSHLDSDELAEQCSEKEMEASMECHVRIGDLDTEDIAGSCTEAMMQRALTIPGTKARIAKLPLTWTVASTCSGSGGFEIVLAKVADSMSNHLPHESRNIFSVHERMVCESERWKQNLLMNWVVNTTPTCCVFDDVTTLSDDAKRLCVRHKKACDLPTNLLWAGSGFSCKTLSKLHNTDINVKRVMSEKNQESTSFRTFAGTVEFLKQSKPLLITLENVDPGDCSNDDSNGATIAKVLAETGYATRMILLNSSNFGLPQRRVRLFILGVHQERAMAELGNSPHEILTSAVQVYLPKLQLDPPPVDAFLYADDSDEIIEELLSREKKKADRTRRRSEQQDGQVQDDLDSITKGEKWKDLHMTIAASRNLAWPVKMPDELKENRWFNTLPQREKEIVGFVYQLNNERLNSGAPLLRFADLYHSANRTPVSTEEEVPTILPSGTIWDLRRKRLLMGFECLALQGLQYDATDIMTNSHTQDLAGNAFPTTIIAACQLSLMCSIEYPSEAEEMDLMSVERMLQAIGGTSKSQ